MTDNQRNFFRIELDASLQCRAMNAAELDSSAEAFFAFDPGFLMPQKIQQIDREAQQLNHQQHVHRDMANYLRLTNRKIDLLSQLVASQQIQQHQAFIQNISLSEAGLAFSGQEDWQQNQYLAIKLMLLPDCIGLYLKAKVILVEPSKTPEQQHFRLEFIDADEHQRHILARHVLHIQSQQLRQRKQTKDQ